MEDDLPMKDQVTGLSAELKALLSKRSKIQVRDPQPTLSWPPGPLDGVAGPVLVDLSKIN